MNKPILKRVYYALKVELASPLCASNGNDENTDRDILINANGDYFLQGTSIAGALRNRIDAKNRKILAGYSEGENGKMSSLFVSDMIFTDNVIKSVRDGVALNEGKQVNNKFDMEILETGARGIMFLNYVLRDEDGPSFEKLLAELVSGINDGTIRFGANKNRGFGKFKVKECYRREFGCENVDEYINFDSKDINNYRGFEFNIEDISSEIPFGNMVRICVPLKLNGGISIRRYSARPNEADYEHITVGRGKVAKPVIPGSSWNGAIRSDIRAILLELKAKDPSICVNTWFGTSEVGKECQSQVVISESIIENSKALKMTRNKINRFDASTTDGALYTEKSYFGGTTELEILVRKDSQNAYEACIGALLIAIKNIQKGYVAIGGQTAVGRGIFSENGEIKLSENNEETYLRALYDYLEQEKSK